MNQQTKTISLRIKDKHKKILRQMAYEVNQVWNAVNAFTSDNCYIPIPEVGYQYVNYSAFDLQKMFKGIRHERELSIGSTTFQEVVAVHAKARKQFKKNKLKWRTSGGSKRALGWIPFKIGALKCKQGQLKFNGHIFNVWDSYGLSDYAFRSGTFSEDARGRWYLNIVVHIDVVESKATSGVGIDLGCKDTATCSDGVKLSGKRIYREYEEPLGNAQRANKKKLVKTIHAKIKNRRKDAIHKFTRDVVNKHGYIVVGNVSSSGLAKTKMAKSVLDAGWFMLKTQLKYKAIGQSIRFEEVNEAYTTQTCSCCGSISCNSPKGMDGLGIREWSCTECGTTHDRDINAAKNILQLGYGLPVEGISVL